VFEQFAQPIRDGRRTRNTARNTGGSHAPRSVLALETRGW
jgi:hypothetical protein